MLALVLLNALAVEAAGNTPPPPDRGWAILERIDRDQRGLAESGDAGRPPQPAEVLEALALIRLLPDLTGRDSGLVERLLLHPYTPIKLATCALLEERAIPVRTPLAVLLSEDDAEAARRCAARALTFAAAGDRTAAVLALVRLLQDSEPGVREQAIASLAALADPRALPALVRATVDDQPEVRSAAIVALGAFDHDSAQAALSRMIHGDLRTVRPALTALGHLGTPAAVALMLRRFDDLVARDRLSETLTDALADAGPAATLPLTARLSGGSADPRANVVIARVLARLGDRRATLPLVRLLNSATPALLDVLTALQALRDPRATPDLLALTAGDSQHLRTRALEVLTAAGDPRAAAALPAALRDPHPAVRHAGVKLFAALGPRAAGDTVVAQVRALVADADPATRGAAAAALSRPATGP